MKSKKKLLIDKILFLTLLLSIFEVLLFILLKAGAYRGGAPALRKLLNIFVYRYSYILDIINNLALTFIMSYIFYMIALIPERKRQQSINKYINIYLMNIFCFLDDIIQVSNHFINTGEKMLNSSPKLISRVCKETGRMDYLTYRDHYKKFYEQFIEEYRHLSHYIAFIDDELRDCLYKIVTCNFICQINELLIKSDEFDEIFVEYLDITEIAKLNTQLKQIL